MFFKNRCSASRCSVIRSSHMDALHFSIPRIPLNDCFCAMQLLCSCSQNPLKLPVKELIFSEVADHHNFAKRYTLSQVLFSMGLTTRLEQIFFFGTPLGDSIQILRKKLASSYFEYDICCYFFHDTYIDIFNVFCRCLVLKKHFAEHLMLSPFLSFTKVFHKKT